MQTHTKFLPVKEQISRLKDGVAPVEIIDMEGLTLKLEQSRSENRPLRVKQGFDASAPDLHIGHSVSIWKLKTFQELGHKVVFLIGDFTGMVGDPSGKSKTRPRLTREEVEVNAQTYRDQVYKILDPEMTEVRFNSEWHGQRNIYEFLELTSHYTIRRMLERDDFWKRFQAEKPISIMEFLYPLIQAYDSVALKADIELGGTDQKFNLVLTRHIQRAYGQDPQVLLLMPLLCGTGGKEKMSKSLGNAIGITDSPDDIYGKIMSIPDDMIREYYLMCSGIENREIDNILSQNDPYQAKHKLANTIVSKYYDENKARCAAQQFLSLFKNKDLPSPAELIEDNAAVRIDNEVEWLPRIIVTAGGAKSNAEANRLIKAGAVSIDCVKVQAEGKNLDIRIEAPFILKVGKRRFYLIYRNEEQLKQLC